MLVPPGGKQSASGQHIRSINPAVGVSGQALCRQGQNQAETQRLTGVSQVDEQEKRHRAQDCGKNMCKSPEARKKEGNLGQTYFKVTRG